MILLKGVDSHGLAQVIWLLPILRLQFMHLFLFNMFLLESNFMQYLACDGST